MYAHIPGVLRAYRQRPVIRSSKSADEHNHTGRIGMPAEHAFQSVFPSFIHPWSAFAQQQSQSHHPAQRYLHARQI